MTLCCSECGHERRVNINVPVAIVSGRYEDLTELELRDHYKDINAEGTRRGLEPSSWIKS